MPSEGMEHAHSFFCQRHSDAEFDVVCSDRHASHLVLSHRQGKVVCRLQAMPPDELPGYPWRRLYEVVALVIRAVR
ncbi:hypothetical protein D3C72_1706230 [compost metagenome]